MRNESDQPGRSQPLSRRKLRRRSFELLFELAQHPGTAIRQLVQRCFENRIVDVDARSDEDVLLFVPADAEDGVLVGEVDENGRAFIGELCTAASEHRELLDTVLSRYPREWKFERLGLPEKTILRMALAELLFMTTPERIVINEALELAKLYAETEAPKFINGILGAVSRDLEKIRREHGLE